MSRPCNCGSGEERYMISDARGIPCGYCCSECEEKLRSTFRPEIFSDSQYDCDEAIEPEDY